MQVCGVFILSSNDEQGPEKAEPPHRSTPQQQGKQLCLTPTGEMKAGPQAPGITAVLTKLSTEGCGSKAQLSFTHQGPRSPSTWPTAAKAADTLSIRRFMQVCRRPGCPDMSSTYSEIASGKQTPGATGGIATFGDKAGSAFSTLPTSMMATVSEAMRLRGKGSKHTGLFCSPCGQEGY